MTKRRRAMAGKARLEFPRKVKAAAFSRAAGRCEKCSAALKTGEGEVDHVLPCELGGEPVLANAQVLCTPCHKEKTATDIRSMRKAERQRDKRSGAIKPKGNLKSAGFPKADRPERNKLDMPPRRGFYEVKPND
jgi:5-methylcytosine-specific restriction endonuclease McrA